MELKMAYKFLFILFFTFLAYHPIYARPYANDANLLINVNPERQQFVDSLGRERFFHGTNIVVKGPPYHPKLEGHDHGTFSEEDMKFLQSLGLNSVRLGKYNNRHGIRDAYTKGQWGLLHHASSSSSTSS